MDRSTLDLLAPDCAAAGRTYPLIGGISPPPRTRQRPQAPLNSADSPNPRRCMRRMNRWENLSTMFSMRLRRLLVPCVTAALLVLVAAQSAFAADPRDFVL